MANNGKMMQFIEVTSLKFSFLNIMKMEILTHRQITKIMFPIHLMHLESYQEPVKPKFYFKNLES